MINDNDNTCWLYSIYIKSSPKQGISLKSCSSPRNVRPLSVVLKALYLLTCSQSLGDLLENRNPKCTSIVHFYNGWWKGFVIHQMCTNIFQDRKICCKYLSVGQCKIAQSFVSKSFGKQNVVEALLDISWEFKFVHSFTK